MGITRRGRSTRGFAAPRRRTPFRESASARTGASPRIPPRAREPCKRARRFPRRASAPSRSQSWRLIYPTDEDARPCRLGEFHALSARVGLCWARLQRPSPSTRVRTGRRALGLLAGATVHAGCFPTGASGRGKTLITKAVAVDLGWSDE
jgi:hypothetical protein